MVTYWRARDDFLLSSPVFIPASATDMKNILRRVVLSLATACTLFGCAQAGLRPLCVLHTNDVHGHIAPERVKGWKKRCGGAPVLAGCVNGVRTANAAAGIPMLLLDAGDILVGTPEVYISEGKAMTEVMNAEGYDAMAIGNHEFDSGTELLAALSAGARFPFLGANMATSPDGAPPAFAKPYLIRECGGLKVGIVGILTDSTPEVTMAGGTDKIRFAPPDPVLRGYVKELAAKGVDFTIVLGHCGIEEAGEIAAEVGGIGLFVAGHDHARLKKPLRARRTGTLIVEAGEYAEYVGKLDAWVDPGSGQIRSYRYELIPMEEGRFPADPAVAKIVEKWRDRAGRKFDEVVGRSVSDFPHGDADETALGDMIADSMREAVHADIAFKNSYAIRHPLLKGRVTYGDVYKVMPFENTLYRMTLTGRQVREILEQSLGSEMLNVSGLAVKYDPSAPKGERVTSVSCGGAPLEEEKEYVAATSAFLAQGGDGFSGFSSGKDVTNTGIVDREAFCDYIKAQQPLSIDKVRQGRITCRRNR